VAQHRDTDKSLQDKDTKAKPLVSVVLPTYNRPDSLTGALKSILQQTFKNIEVVVVNDGGCDVQNVIDEYSRSLNIKYISCSQNKGPAAARNAGIKQAGGKYIAYLDDDDMLYSCHIQTLVDFLETTDYNVAYTDAYRVLQKKQGDSYLTISKEIYHSQDFNREHFLVASYIAILSVMHQRFCIEQVGYFDESLSTHEDLDMWIRLSQNYDFGHIRKATAEFKEKNDDISVTSSNKLRRLTNLELIYQRYSQLASPQVRYLQKKVLQRMYDNYGLELPGHLE
jgi:glycosyltransferase involved in cell wall biosynthesis